MGLRGTFFWNMIANNYSKQNIANEEAYKRKLLETQKLFTDESEVFEFGCGTGSTALYHAPKVKSILATDIAEKMIAIANEKKQNLGIENVKFQCESIESNKSNPESFDIVMAMSILHLVEDKEAVLKKIHKLLKEDGYLVCSTACIEGFFPFLKFILNIGNKFAVLPLVKSFTPDNLLSSLKDAGFEIVTHWQPSPKEAIFIIAKKI